MINGLYSVFSFLLVTLAQLFCSVGESENRCAWLGPWLAVSDSAVSVQQEGKAHLTQILITTA